MNRHRTAAAPPLPVRSAGMASRPRAPSPPVMGNGKFGSSEDDSESVDSDNTYSVVQDSMLGGGGGRAAQLSSRPPPMPPKTKILSNKKGNNNRMFGDSVNPSPASSVTGSSASSSAGSSPTTTGLYQKRAQTQRRATTTGALGKAGGGGMSKYDAATVEEIKAQFQRQIETMLQSQERNSRNNTLAAAPASVATPRLPAGVRTSHLQSEREKELDDIRDLQQRGKSFLEARTAVQKQIERMFSEAAVGGGASPGGPVPGGGHPGSKETLGIKHTMHGVSHQLLEDPSGDIKPPPPVHYGIRAAIKQITISDGNRSQRVSNKWQSAESLSAAAAASRQQAAAEEEEPFVQDRPPPKPSKFRSMENVSRSNSGGLTRTLVDVHSADIHDPEVSDRLRKFKMENGKSTPNLSSVSNPGKATVCCVDGKKRKLILLPAFPSSSFCIDWINCQRQEACFCFCATV